MTSTRLLRCSLPIFFSLLLASACGDDDGPSTGGPDAGTGRDASSPPADTGAPAQTVEERFAESCDVRVSMCADDAADCARQGECYVGWLREDVVRAYAACREDCDASDDTCGYTAITGASRTAAGDAYDEACMARETECGGFGGGDSPCAAGFGSVLLDPLLEESNACLERDCLEVRDCLRALRPEACNG